MPKKPAAAVESLVHDTEKLSIASKPSKHVDDLNTPDKTKKKAAKKTTVVEDSSSEGEAPAPAKAPKSPEKAKRKPSEYNLFIGEQIKKIGEDHKELPVTERMKMAQKLWKERKESLATAKA